MSDGRGKGRAGSAKVGSSEIPLTDETLFRHWTSEKIRFQDVDRLDHVNNVTFATYAESGRIEFLEHVSPASVIGNSGTLWVIARLALQYREQTHYPGEIRIGTCVIDIGRSSVTLGQGMFEGDRCVVTAESVVVMIGVESGRSVPLPQDLRQALSAYVAR